MSRGSSTATQEHPRADLRDIDGEQRVRDIRIGEVGGLARSRTVREVIEANRDELLCYGELPVLTATSHYGAGARQVQEYWLNEEQSLAVLTGAEIMATPWPSSCPGCRWMRPRKTGSPSWQNTGPASAEPTTASPGGPFSLDRTGWAAATESSSGGQGLFLQFNESAGVA
jgi:hypothetical protein